MQEVKARSSASAVGAEKPGTPFNPRKIPKFGVALFTDPDVVGDGWACASDGEAFFFSAPHELNTDVVWVTNLSYEAFRSKGKTFTHLRSDDYLSANTKKIAEDLGYRDAGAYSEATCRALAVTVQRTLTTAIYAYDWASPDEALRSDKLYEDIRRTIQTPPKSQRHMSSPLAGAYQASSKVEWPSMFSTNTVSVTLRQNRLEYAQKLLSITVPDDAWTYIPPENTSRLKLDELLNPKVPCLVEAAVELSTADQEIAALVAFGTVSGSRRSTALRRWISQPELTWLVRHANVKINAAFVASSAMSLPAASLLPQVLTSDPLFAASLSAGLVAEAHVQALMEKEYVKSIRGYAYNSWAVWLKAVDRAMSFQYALAAHKAGFRVFAYGKGAVALSTDKSRLPALLEYAEANNFAHPVFYGLFKEHGFV